MKKYWEFWLWNSILFVWPTINYTKKNYNIVPKPKNSSPSFGLIIWKKKNRGKKKRYDEKRKNKTKDNKKKRK